MQIVRADGVAEQARIDEMKQRAAKNNAQIDRAVADILQDIAENGYAAVEKYSLQFDGAAPREITGEELDKAVAQCQPDVVDALRQAEENIRSYHEKMLVSTWEYERRPGERLGQLVRGLRRVGIYVPGGTAAYPSSVLMNAVPAKVAGVQEIIMVTPPTENLNVAVLAAARIAGVDRVIAVGGVQAIGALAHGAGFIPRVDKMVGPGNAYVASAKRQVFGLVDIDMIAGPSEVLVIADKTANPVYVAADLLSQAEHDVLASVTLVTDDMALAQQVKQQAEEQMEQLERRDIMKQSWEQFGSILVFDSLADACRMANEIAPEHLEIYTEHPRELLPLIENAGAIFLGGYAPEPLGDYMAGPSHVLPTSGTARFFSPLSVDTFLKKTSLIEYTPAALERVSDQVIALARNEKLTAHANSILVRFPK